MREIVLDTETTGLDPRQGHRIIEIGAIEMYNKVHTGKSFHYYINPERQVPFEAFQIHGISTEYLQDKPKFIEIADEFIKFVEGGKLVIHNATFDMNFLNYELGLLNMPSLDYATVIDTLPMARRMFPGQRNNLDALCKRFRIDNSNRQYHGALKDANLLLEVYIELTGGRQTKLALDKNESEEFQLSGKSKNSYSNMDFRITKPTEDEVILHKEFMKKI